MNYQIQADRQELMEGKKSTEEKRGREAPVIDDIDLLAEFPVRTIFLNFFAAAAVDIGAARIGVFCVLYP